LSRRPTSSPTELAGLPSPALDVLAAIDEQLLDRLVGQARADGLQLTGEADCWRS
jgi:hypothetical protein